jgi:hypothetical protein
MTLVQYYCLFGVWDVGMRKEKKIEEEKRE